ncbi:MAG: prephenate dehydrogenase/arogenate dehydrogenase family protein [Paludibacterium sp.]|uniref:prephenate dehydrogenase n=1 Tax=Paludibacterium sp. TaxID=1917523 RepID=UPI0025F747FA|nr:prephenate dehydrogenase/arogenate dehydrogenase family protein [Paludibacterium sp.]MBV8047843.1 prephenate dehydrogenase/arogenate dehydrogenase family protein [Paludibacterium sp.]MBV8648137.1 prephenate dehydrogenase/arogenate dehydrogenase family protein [Paludibacterium sp.]
MGRQGIRTLVVVGVGLIGGSFALALKRAGLVERVIGVDRSADNLRCAQELGVVDVACDALALAAAEADLVLLATPVGQMAACLSAMAPTLPPHALITDVGSTKGNVVRIMRETLPDRLARCVPAHPIAGSELSGAAAAQYGLYENRDVVLTPMAETDPSAVETLAALWRACGAHIAVLDPDEHDRVFAAVSHLPHLLAFSYVNLVADRDNAERCLDFASTGFRDFTRIAGSSPEMWRDVALANRPALLAALHDYRAELDRLIGEVEGEDGTALTNRFGRARQVRTAWYQKFLRK